MGGTVPTERKPHCIPKSSRFSDKITDDKQVPRDSFVMSNQERRGLKATDQ